MNILEIGIEHGMERGMERGIERGMKMGVEIGIERIVLNMYQKGFALEQIASVANKTVEEVKAIVEAKEAVLV